MRISIKRETVSVIGEQEWSGLRSMKLSPAEVRLPEEGRMNLVRERELTRI